MPSFSEFIEGAAELDDFRPNRYFSDVVYFPADGELTVFIGITNDSEPEDVERFVITLELVTPSPCGGGVKVMWQSSFIKIHDDDGELYKLIYECARSIL